MSTELACVYAALILHDEGIEITTEKLNALIQAAGVKIESYWIDLFADFFKTHDVSEMIKVVNLDGTGGTVAQASTVATSPVPFEEEKEEEAKPLDTFDIFDDF